MISEVRKKGVGEARTRTVPKADAVHHLTWVEAKLLVLGVKGVIVSRITGTERLVLSEPSPLLDSSD